MVLSMLGHALEIQDLMHLCDAVYWANHLIIYFILQQGPYSLTVLDNIP